MSKNIKKNYIYNVIYQVLLIIIPIITTPYVSHVLLPEGVGQYSFTSSLINYYLLFASLGFGIYAQREIAKFQGNKKEQSIVFWEINICRLISVFISLLLNIIFVFTNVYGNNSLLMLIFSINIISVAFDISFLFQGNENFEKLVINNLVIRIIGTISIFIFIKTQNDVWVYVLINALSTIFSCLLMWIYLKQYLVKISVKELKPFKHLMGTLKLFIPTIASSIYVILDKSLIGFITGSNAENGYYEQAEKIVKMILTIITCMGTVMIPRNTYEIQQGNFDKVKQNVYNSFHFVWVLGIPIMAGIIIVSPNLVPWFLGESFNTCILLMQLLSLIIIIIGLSNILGLQYLIPMKRDKLFTISITVGAITNLIFNIPLIYFYKSLGAVISTILAELVVTIIMFVFVRKDFEFKNFFKSIIKPIIGTVVMVVVLIPISLKLTPSIINTLIIAGAGSVVYLIMLLIL